MAGDSWFEQRSPQGIVRLVRSPLCPDPDGYFLYHGEDLIGRHSGLARGRKAFRQLADLYDPPRPVPIAEVDPKRELGDEMAHAYFASMRGSGQGKGGRSKVKRS